MSLALYDPGTGLGTVSSTLTCNAMGATSSDLGDSGVSAA